MMRGATTSTSSRMFRVYGELCAAHPWEVIVTFTAAFTCLLTVEQLQLRHQHQLQKAALHPPGEHSAATKPVPSFSHAAVHYEEQFRAIEIVLMTAVRCLAVLFSTHRLRKLHSFGCKLMLMIGGLFAAASSFVFTVTVLSVLNAELADLKDALVFFLLLTDLSKAATLAQFALASKSRKEIRINIAHGLATLGPMFTLDTLVETLVISVGTLSGVYRLEVLAYYACLSAVVNYIIFMTFYPACLSLVLELNRPDSLCILDQSRKPISVVVPKHMKPPTTETELIATATTTDHHKSNPVVQRVKVIMATGLMLVHVYSRFYATTSSHAGATATTACPTSDAPQVVPTGALQEDTWSTYLLREMVTSVDQIVIIILLTTLVVKFVFFEQEATSTASSSTTGCDSTVATTVKTVSLDKPVQTVCADQLAYDRSKTENRSLEECLEVFRHDDHDSNSAKMARNRLSDAEIRLLIDTKHIAAYNLETILGDCERGVRIRRQLTIDMLGTANVGNCLQDVPYKSYDYSKVLGNSCENVIGYVPVPLGTVGPLNLDGREYLVPMATTEGCLVASTNRGCRALSAGGVISRLTADGMSRAPLVRFATVARASDLKVWLDDADHFQRVKRVFDSTSGYAQLLEIGVCCVGRSVYLRFCAATGDAMGMNMVSKGTEQALRLLQTVFTDMEVVTISGNYCSDKKPAAVNWVCGRGKSVICEAVVPAASVRTVLKTTSHKMVDVNVNKNLVGSAMAGSVGGFNAHAANIVTAIFLATGQDPAQNVTSSNCITIMEPWGENGDDLYVACTMPSLEVGTVGGGTRLPAQAACLDMLGVRGASQTAPGANAKQLARIICGTVLAGEVSLIAALATGQLVNSHLTYNRTVGK